MPNLRLAGVTAKRAKRGRRRRTRSKGGGLRGWWRVIKFALIVKKLRRRERERSSPSVRQIVLVVVSGTLAIVIIRGASRRAMAAKGARAADGETQDQVPAPEAPSAPTTPVAEEGLTERVRAEMFENEN
jgi:hypothetical protein